MGRPRLLDRDGRDPYVVGPGDGGDPGRLEQRDDRRLGRDDRRAGGLRRSRPRRLAVRRGRPTDPPPNRSASPRRRRDRRARPAVDRTRPRRRGAPSNVRQAACTRSSARFASAVARRFASRADRTRGRRLVDLALQRGDRLQLVAQRRRPGCVGQPCVEIGSAGRRAGRGGPRRRRAGGRRSRAARSRRLDVVRGWLGGSLGLLQRRGGGGQARRRRHRGHGDHDLLAHRARFARDQVRPQRRRPVGGPGRLDLGLGRVDPRGRPVGRLVAAVSAAADFSCSAAAVATISAMLPASSRVCARSPCASISRRNSAASPALSSSSRSFSSRSSAASTRAVASCSASRAAVAAVGHGDRVAGRGDPAERPQLAVERGQRGPRRLLAQRALSPAPVRPGRRQRRAAPARPVAPRPRRPPRRRRRVR